MPSANYLMLRSARGARLEARTASMQAISFTRFRGDDNFCALSIRLALVSGSAPDVAEV